MYGQEYGAILPNSQQSPIQTYRELKNEQDQRALQNAKYLKDTLDFSQYATGVPEYDPVIHQTIADAMKDLTKKALNPTYSQAQLLLDANNYTQKLNDYSSKAKLIDQQLQAKRALAAKNKYVDPEAWYRLAKLSAFHDGNGALKDINSVDPNTDYWEEAFKNHYDDIVRGDGGIGDLIKASEKRPISSQIVKDQNGVKTTSKYAGQIYPAFNTTIKDPTTGVVTGIGIKSKKAKLPDGSMVDVVDDDVYNSITQDRFMDASLNKIVRSNGIDPQSPEGEVAKRKALYDYLQTKGVGYFEHTGDETDNSDLWRQREMNQRQRESQAFRREMKEATKSGSGQSDVPYFDVYGDMKKNILDYKGIKNIPLNRLLPQSQSALLGYAQDLYGDVPVDDTGKTRKLNYGDIWVRPNDDGTFTIMKSSTPKKMDTKDEEIVTMDEQAANTLKGVNTTARERQSARNSQTTQSTPQSRTPVYSRSDLKKAGWTDDQIKIAVKAGKIKVQ